MLDDLLKVSGKLVPPDHTLVLFTSYLSAIENTMPKDGKLGKKQILLFS